MNNRRQFMLASVATVAASRLVTSTAFGADRKRGNKVCVFTKPFNSLSFDELADKIAELGFDGIEAPIRAGGHIEPKEVEERLPLLVEALKKRNLEINVMTCDVNDVNDPLTRSVLRTAATLGIQRYRMKYVAYDKDQPVHQQLREWNAQFRELAAMNHDFGIRGLYQNHAGSKNLGAVIWDIAEVLEGIDPTDIAVAYDIRHAMVEGGQSWPVTFRMIQPRIDTVFVKDYAWVNKQVVNVPLGEGHVTKDVFKMLADIQFEGPISLHEEYLDHDRVELVPQHWTAIKNDLATLDRWMNG